MEMFSFMILILYLSYRQPEKILSCSCLLIKMLWDPWETEEDMSSSTWNLFDFYDDYDDFILFE